MCSNFLHQSNEMRCTEKMDIFSGLYELGMHHVINQILSYLDPISMKSFESTCAKWEDILTSENVWQKFFSKAMKEREDWRSFDNIVRNLKVMPKSLGCDSNNNSDPDSARCVLLHEAVQTFETSWKTRECVVEKVDFMKKEFRINSLDHFQMNENYIAFFLREMLTVKVFNRWTLELQCVLKLPSIELGDTLWLGETFILGLENDTYHINDFVYKRSAQFSEESEEFSEAKADNHSNDSWCTLDSNEDAADKTVDQSNGSWCSLDSNTGPKVRHLCVHDRLILSLVDIPDFRDLHRNPEEAHQSQQHLILRRLGAQLEIAKVKQTVIPPEVQLLNMEFNEKHIAFIALVKQRHWIHVPAEPELGSWELRLLSTSTLETLHRIPDWSPSSFMHLSNGLLVTCFDKSVRVWDVDSSFGVDIVDPNPITSAWVLSPKYIATTNSSRNLKIWEVSEGRKQGLKKPSLFSCLTASLIPGLPRSHKEIAILGGDKYQIILASRDIFKYSLYGDGLSKFYRINFLPPSLQAPSPLSRTLDIPHYPESRNRASAQEDCASFP